MIIIIIPLLVVLLGLAALNWDTIIKALKGKKVAVLGARKVGKTRLINFLSKGSLPKKYEGTNYPEPVRGRRFQLKELKLVIKDMVDVPGRGGYTWERIVKDADIVLYLLRVDRLMKGHKPTEDRVQRDIGRIKRWLDDNPKEFPLFIIGTHCDRTDPDWTTLSADQIVEYEDKVRDMAIFQDLELLGGGARNVTLVARELKVEGDNGIAGILFV